ncbi:MAG: AAA family ATPase [bacterium JZ-2024 1]
MDRARAYETAVKLIRNIEAALIASPGTIEFAMACLLAEGHLLIEDVPGTGKTTLAKAIAASISLTFQRIQLTPDILPSDITGGNVYNQQKAVFEFRPGPIFTNILLADEINRASPRTQAALLEAMEEHQVTVEGKTYPLESPFFVIATENPLEYQGVYRLPEAQLDRFSMRIRLGYLPRPAEARMLKAYLADSPLKSLQPVLTREDFFMIQSFSRAQVVSDRVYDYAIRLGEATRNHPDLLLGASPRAILSLLRIAQAYSFLQGRDFVIPDDLKTLWVPCLAHRVHLKPQVRVAGLSESDILPRVLDEIPVPVS